MGILFEKFLAKILFWIYDLIDTLGAIFNILTGTQTADGQRTLLEVFAESAVSTKVILGLCMVAVVIAGACMAVRIVKNTVKFKAGGEQTSNATVVKLGFYAVLSSVICIFFVFMFISFAGMLLNMVNSVIAPENNMTLSQNLFNLSVEQSYVIDEDKWETRYTDYLDEYGNRVQATDPNSPDGLAWERDAYGNQILDEDNNPIEIWVQVQKQYHPYKTDAEGNLIIESGWCNHTDSCRKNSNGTYFSEVHGAACLDWSLNPDMVFGVHEKDWIGLFEEADEGYTRRPMVRLESFNLFTAYLVAIIVFISMFMLSVGLVKRIYDIIVLIVCMPLVCGTIPLDDGARFRAWRETFMSKVLVAFGAVIALNVFYMISSFIMSPAFDLTYFLDNGILNGTAVTIFKMLLLLGGAMCINGSQVLVARILGTSADESREAMQSFAMITSGVRLGAAGMLGAGCLAMGGGRMIFGGTNRYGRQRTGLIPMAFRGGNAIGERVGGENYVNSRGGAFVRFMGRMGNKQNNNANAGKPAETNKGAGISLPTANGGLDKPVHSGGAGSDGRSGPAAYSGRSVSQPGTVPHVGSGSGNASAPANINNSKTVVSPQKSSGSSVRPNDGGLKSGNGGSKSAAFNDSANKRGKR